MLAYVSFWDTTNLANWGTIIGGIAVILTGLGLVWRRVLKHLREAIAPVSAAVTRNGGSSMADAIFRIEATQKHIHGQIDKMEQKLDDTSKELYQHIGWHRGQK